MSKLTSLPDVIEVDSSILKKKAGGKTTIAKRRTNSEPVRGRRAGRRNYFTDEEKLNAVCVFAISGNSRRVAEITGIPEGTIRSWKTTEWWNDAISRVHSEQDEEINSKLTNLIDKAVVQVNDRLEHGDYVYDTKRGELVRKPVSAKDLTVVTAIAVDKRQLLRGQPTSRVEKVTQDERLAKLAADFRKFSSAIEVKQEPELIEVEEEIIDVEEDFEDEPTVNELFSE